MTALGTVLYYREQGRDEEADGLMCDVQYKVGGSTFVHLYLRHYLPDAEQEDLRLFYEELNESVVVRLGNSRVVEHAVQPGAFHYQDDGTHQRLQS